MDVKLEPDRKLEAAGIDLMFIRPSSKTPIGLRQHIRLPSIAQRMKMRRLVQIVCLAAVMMAARPCHADETDTPEFREFINRQYPFIEQGQEPPGRFATDEKLGGMMTWQGPSGWRTRHGQAIVAWSLGKPSWVEDALLPDGSRGKVMTTLDHGFRRKGTGDRLWIYGRIEIGSGDVVFVDGEQPVYQPPPQGDVPDLEADLARDPAFLAAMKDDRFALAVRTVFNNRGFYKDPDLRLWECGERQAARLVADLRGKGESYLDYYPAHGSIRGIYPDDRPDMERQLQSSIDQVAKQMDLPLSIPFAELNAWLGPGQHSAAEVREAMERMRPWLERQQPQIFEDQRKQRQAALEKAQQNLVAFRADHDNEDVLELVRSHLSRLGWRTETDRDRERVHQEWVQRAVGVLAQVKELEQRPAATPEAWTERLRNPPSSFRSFEPGALEKMSPDVRAVETGELEKRLRDLALTGRVTEPEYLVLVQKLFRAAHIGNLPKLTAAPPLPAPAQHP